MLEETYNRESASQLKKVSTTSTYIIETYMEYISRSYTKLGRKRGKGSDNTLETVVFGTQNPVRVSEK